MVRATIYFVLLLVVAACSADNKQERQKDTLASIDDLGVTKEHYLASFKRYYHKSGQALEANTRNRKAVLEAEMKPYMLSVHARDKGWADDETARRRKEMIRRKVYAEEYLEKFVLDTVQVTEADLRFLFYKFNTKVRASHLFARTRTEIDSIYDELREGKGFHELAGKTFKSDYLAKNGGDLGVFGVDEMDVAFENKAYRMSEGEVSKPVKTTQGYSIIKVTEKHPKPILTEQEFHKRKPQLRTFAIKQQEELATREHLKQKTEELNPQGENILKLWSQIKQQRSKFVDYSTRSGENRLQLSLNDDVPLTDNGNFTYTVGDFREDLYYTPRKSRQNISKSHQFVDFLKGLAYQSYAVKTFAESRHASDVSVEQSINQTFYDYLSNRVSDSIRANVSIPEDAMREEYWNNNRLYSNDVQLNLAKIEFDEKKTAKQALKEIKGGTSFEKALQQYTTQGSDLLNDGKMGYMSINRMGRFSEQFKGTRPGDLVGPLKYHENRYMLFKCLGRKVVEKSFEEAKPEIYNNMIGEYVKQRKVELIKKVKKVHDYEVDEQKLKDLKISLNN